MLNGKYILISGSASRFCEDGKLDVAIQFVRQFTVEVLARGEESSSLPERWSQQGMSTAIPEYSIG